MIGLIKKDFLLIAKSFSPIYLCCFLAIILPVSQNPQTLMPIISLMISLLFAAQILTTLSLDEVSKWRKSLTAMPVSTYEEVLSKYLVSIILSLMSLLIVCIIGIISMNFMQLPKELFFFYLVWCFCISILYSSIVIPASFKYGTSKCRMVLLIFVTVPTVIPLIFNALNINIDINNFNLTIYNIILILIIITFVVLAISYITSVKIQNKRI